MPSTNLNITVIEKRLLRKAEAAEYVGLAQKHFSVHCPVQTIELRQGEIRWDKRDLDRWIDGMKDGADASDRDEILGRL